MLRIYRIVGGDPLVSWEIGQFANANQALAEYNSEVRRGQNEGIDDGRPALQFAKQGTEVQFFLTEEEVTHTETRRDEAVETGRWGLRADTVGDNVVGTL